MNIANLLVNEQSSIRILASSKLYIDPFNLPEETHDADMVFVTHEHYDHFSFKDIDKAANEKTIYAVPKPMKKTLLKHDIPEDRIYPLVPGQSALIAGLRIQAVAAYNLNKPFHPKSNGWLGYVIEIDGSRVYICGDTDDTPEARAVRCDIVCVPVGGTYTMDAKEAAAFVNYIKPRIAVPVHYGSVVGKPADADIFERNVYKNIPVCRKLFF